MKMTSRDHYCRYLSSPGTRSEGGFGACLRECGVELPQEIKLDYMVRSGWIRPVLRVRLPRRAFDAWKNFPVLSMEGVEDCPEEDHWALSLYGNAVSGWPSTKEKWWVHFLDDPEDSLTQAARANSIDPTNQADLPPVFRHARYDQEIRPWMDYFAYWQVFQVAELSYSMSYTIALTEAAVAHAAWLQEHWAIWAADRAESIRKKWEKRQPTFEWLSRMRTVLGSTPGRACTWQEVDDAFRSVATGLALTPSQMQTDIRDTLLVMWEEWTGTHSPIGRRDEKLLHLLRQEIQYAVLVVERLTGKPADFLSSFWYDARQRHLWARLIDALPREEELARLEFPRHARGYVPQFVGAVPGLATLTESAIQELVAKHWERSRPLRRFVLAFHRLHEQLHGEKLMDSEDVIRATEQIEQFILTVLHSERVLSSEYRERTGTIKYPDVRALAKNTLNHLFTAWNLHKGGHSATAQARAQELLEERAMLHDLDTTKGLRFVSPGEVGSGSDVADNLVAAMVNFVIVRNYAAHHDAMDDDLVYPAGKPDHPGGVALGSVLLAVLAALITHTPPSASPSRAKELT